MTLSNINYFWLLIANFCFKVLINIFWFIFFVQASLSGENSCQHHESEFDEGEGSSEDEMYEEESDEEEEDETKTRLAWDKSVWAPSVIRSGHYHVKIQEATSL